MQILTQKISSILKIVVFVFAIICSIFCTLIANNSNSEYRLLFLWPICFLFFLIINYSKNFINSHYLALTLIVFTQMVPRYLVYPVLVFLSSRGFVGTRHIPLSSSEIQYGILIVVYELICFSLFLFFYEKIAKKKRIYEGQMKISGNRIIYVFYMLFAVIVYFVIGRRLNVVQFITIRTSYSEITENTLFMLVKYVISIAITLFVLLVFAREKRRYEIRKHNVHFIAALLFGILLTLIIVGESRGTQITIGILSILILIGDYPNKKTLIISFIGAAILIIVIVITVFRTGSVNTIIGSSIDYLARQFQIYYGGPDSVYQSIKVFQTINTSILNLLFDFIRSCFPFNLVFKNYGSTISQIYNQTLYQGLFSSGHIVFSASYSYIFFGFLGIPLTMCFNYYLASKACEFFNRTDSYEVKYLAGYCMLKLVNAFCVNTPSILGSVTQYIGTFGLLLFVSEHITMKSPNYMK